MGLRDQLNNSESQAKWLSPTVSQVIQTPKKNIYIYTKAFLEKAPPEILNYQLNKNSSPEFFFFL